MNESLRQEMRMRILRILDQNPRMNQREIASRLGISLGAANYCLRALKDVGLIKAERFLNSRNKAAYAYLLTPQGVEEKVRLTTWFLRRKLDEYEALKGLIKELRSELPGEYRKLDPEMLRLESGL
jgi:EPS-associated MarR family transcriptional regulator